MTVESTIKRGAYWASDWCKGSIVRSGFKDISAIMEDYDYGHDILQRRLLEMLQFAVRHTEYYEDYGDLTNSLSAWPVLTKLDLINDFDKHRVPVDQIPGQGKRPVYLQKTGGSTGVPFAVPQDFLKRQRRISEIKWFNELNGFKSHERLCHCRVWTQWQNKSRWQTFKENIYAFNVENMGPETIHDLIDLIESKKIEVLRGYASWHRTLMEHFESGKDNPERLSSLKLIISESDTLDERTRELVAKHLGCPIIDSYGTEENGTLGYQTIGNSDFVLNHPGYIFEVLDFDSDRSVACGEVGRLVVTDLFNHAFPMIRYDTGDACVLSGSDNEWPVMTKLFGRRLDIVYDTQGNPLQPMSFSRVLKNYPDIMQWQFIQTGQRDYTTKLCVRDTGHLDDIRDSIASIVGSDGEITIDLVDDVPVLRSGKKKPVVQEWSGE